MEEIKVTKDILDHWVGQDLRRLGWWIDLLFLADSQGVVHLSLSDLAHRWDTTKVVVQRFIEKLSNDTVCDTKVIRLKGMITISKSSTYGVSKNEERYDFDTADDTAKEIPLSPPSFSSPTPPTISPPIIPQENPDNASARMREDEFVRRYREEGMWLDVAMILHVTDLDMCKKLFDEFVVEYRHKGDMHNSYTDFKKHFIQWARIAVSKRPRQQELTQPQKQVISGQAIFDIYK